MNILKKTTLCATILLGITTMAIADTDVKALEQKAKRGDAQSQFNLGFLYETGRGLPQSHIKAYMWTLVAKSSGYPYDISMTLKEITEGSHMSATDINKAKQMAQKCTDSKWQDCWYD